MERVGAGGEFHLSPSEGPGAGPHVVEIVAIRPTGRSIESPDHYGAKVEETANIIPPRYYSQSDLRIEATPEGENAFRFDLSSREAPTKSRRAGRHKKRAMRRRERQSGQIRTMAMAAIGDNVDFDAPGRPERRGNCTGT